MNRDLWKWVFEAVPDEQLIAIAKDLNVNKYEAQVKAVEKLKAKLHETQTKLDAALKLVEKQSREGEREQKNFHERIRELEQTLEAREADWNGKIHD